MSTRQAPPTASPISYEQWGVDFFHEAISEERVLGAVNTIAGQPIDFGPMGVGPGRIAKVGRTARSAPPRRPGSAATRSATGSRCRSA